MQNIRAEIILSTAYFPPIEYFALIGKTDNVWIEKHENYIKQSYRNRSNIMSANGILPLIIPVKRHRGKKTAISEIKPDYNYKWQKIHRISIESAYRSAPFYEYYIDEIRPFFETRYDHLIELNSAILDKMLEILKIRRSWKHTETYINTAADCNFKRVTIHPKIKNPEKAVVSEQIKYTQVFQDRWGFLPGLSILDLIFNAGPDAARLLKSAASELLL